MEEDRSTLPGALGAGREDAFDVVVRGYNKRQVEEAIARLRDQVTGLERRVSGAVDAAERARRELLQAQEALREANSREPQGPKPAHEQVSERLSQILRLAAEEAEQSRAKAEDEITQLRRRTEDESAQLLASARAEADHVLASNRQTADRELASARDEARHLVETSQAEAKRTTSESQAKAERLISDAEARADAVNEVAGRRLEVITGSHADAVRRLSSIRELISGLLAEEAAAGPVMAAVENAMAAVNAGTGPTGRPVSVRPDRDRVLDLDAVPSAVAAATSAPALSASAAPRALAARPVPAGLLADEPAEEPAPAPTPSPLYNATAAALTEPIMLPAQGAQIDPESGERDSFGALFLPQP